MKKIIVAVLLALMVLTGCQSGSGSDEPLIYQGRMKHAGSDIYIDTETGVCYWKNGDDVIILVDRHGDPYIANGWRDWGGDE